MENLKKSIEEKMDNLIKFIRYEQLPSALKLFPSMWRMKQSEFFETLNDEMGYNFAPVCYETKKPFPIDKDIREKLPAAIEAVFEKYTQNSDLTSSQKESIELVRKIHANDEQLGYISLTFKIIDWKERVMDHINLLCDPKMLAYNSYRYMSGQFSNNKDLQISIIEACNHFPLNYFLQRGESFI